MAEHVHRFEKITEAHAITGGSLKHYCVLQCRDCEHMIHADSEPTAYTYYLDNQRFDTNRPTLRGFEVKAIASRTPTYQLVQREPAPEWVPATPIGDYDVIDLAGGPKHFYAIPPASW